MKKLRSFSALKPTGDTHIGNYIGAIQQWVQRQDENENLYCIVDLHALTIVENVNPEVLKQRTREVAMLYIACGLDPVKNNIFIQSHVKEHAELCWLLNCVTPVGWLERMTQYKSKAAELKSVGTGLLDYPVLMAADILLYDADVVPVGDDQLQHVELCRDIAGRFNHLFGETFKLPEYKLPQSGARIMSLDNPQNKMSKSDGAKKSGHSIGLLDDEKTIKKAINRSVTDDSQDTSFESASPGVLNLLTIYKSLTDFSNKEIENRFEGKGYGYLKNALFEVVLDKLTPIQKEYNRLSLEVDYMDNLLSANADKARQIASKTVDLVKQRCGIG